MKNYRASFLCLIAALLLPFVAIAQERTDAQDADTNSNAAVIQSIQTQNTGAKITAFSEDFVRQCVEVWSKVTRFKDAAGALNLVLDASKALDVASNGHWYSGNDDVEKAQTWAENQQQFLVELSHKNSNDWLMESGFNSFNASTMPAAQDDLDGWIQEMANLQQIIDSARPALASVKLTVGMTAIAKFSHGDQLTTVLGAPEAIDEISSALSSSGRLIDIILQQLRLARSVAVSAVDPAQQAQNIQQAESAADQAAVQDADDDQDTEADDDDTDQSGDVQQQGQQMLQNLYNMMQNNARNQGAQVRNGGQAQTSQCVGERCY